jgi:hypothetical protein
MTGRAARIADPTVCDECGHDVDLHRSTGCLYMLGAGCPCMHDLRHAKP